MHITLGEPGIGLEHAKGHCFVGVSWFNHPVGTSNLSGGSNPAIQLCWRKWGLSSQDCVRLPLDVEPRSNLFLHLRRQKTSVAMAKAPVVLGIVGGALGLVTSAVGFLLSIVLTVLTFGGLSFLLLPTALDGLGAILGIAGGAISSKKLRPGGGLILAGVVVGTGGWLVTINDVAGKRLQVTPYILFMTSFFLWWAVLMLIGGLLAIIRKTNPVPVENQPPHV